MNNTPHKSGHPQSPSEITELILNMAAYHVNFYDFSPPPASSSSLNVTTPVISSLTPSGNKHHVLLERGEGINKERKTMYTDILHLFYSLFTCMSEQTSSHRPPSQLWFFLVAAVSGTPGEDRQPIGRLQASWATVYFFLIKALFVCLMCICSHGTEPIFIDAHLIPDGSDPNDAKLYFFLRERLTDNSGNTKNIHAMVARVCPVSVPEWVCESHKFYGPVWLFYFVFVHERKACYQFVFSFLLLLSCASLLHFICSLYFLFLSLSLSLSPSVSE